MALRPGPDTGARPARLTLEDVGWGPSPGRQILFPLTLDIAPGAFVAVVGANGAGKSTLLRCLYRYHRPTSGRVLLDGEDIWAQRPRAVARRIATVLQEPPGDFGLTVAEIVELGRTPHAKLWTGAKTDDDKVASALDAMSLTAFASRPFASLSGGEKQRTLIARALVQQPDLLILDEPTNHLDIRHQLEVLELLAGLPSTVIVSLHDLALASAHADAVLLIEAGRALAYGPPVEVLTPERIAQSFSVATILDDHPVTGRPRFSFHLER